jgi:hypothetical protein
MRHAGTAVWGERCTIVLVVVVVAISHRTNSNSVLSIAKAPSTSPVSRLRFEPSNG